MACNGLIPLVGIKNKVRYFFMFLDKYIPGSNLAIFTAIVSAMVSLIAYSFQNKLTSLINPLFTNKNAIFKSLYVVGSIGLIICIILFSTTIVQASLIIYSIFYKLGWASFHNFSIQFIFCCYKIW